MYSGQLIFLRPKLVPRNLYQPRSELLAATLNTHTGKVVGRSFSELHKKKPGRTQLNIKSKQTSKTVVQQ